MRRVKLSDDAVIRYIQYARVCKKYGCMPSVATPDGIYLDVPDDIFDEVQKIISSRPKVIVQVKFPAQLLTADTFKQNLGVEPVQLFYSPEGIFVIAFDDDVDMSKLMDLLRSLFTPVIEVK